MNQLKKNCGIMFYAKVSPWVDSQKAGSSWYFHRKLVNKYNLSNIIFECIYAIKTVSWAKKNTEKFGKGNSGKILKDLYIVNHPFSGLRRKPDYYIC